MLQLNAQQTAQALEWKALIGAIKKSFIEGCAVPERHHHEFEIPGEQAGSLLLMPAWVSGRYLGVKQVLVIPENARRKRPAVCASYQLFSAQNGDLLAIIDGGVLTNRRTAAASALAASFLAQPDASHLLMVGTGGLAPCLIEAHCAVRPITRISIWGRQNSKSQSLAQHCRSRGLNAQAVKSLEESSTIADIISCATLSETPLIHGNWLKPGCHVDLVGAFTATMRESDDDLMARASIFVDTQEGALSEAGDIIQAIQSGAIHQSDIQGNLFNLCRGESNGRKSSSEITVFKSVGTALEDLSAAVMAYEQVCEIA